MADNNETVLSQEPQGQQLNAELDRQMQMSLSGVYIPEIPEVGNGLPTTPVTTEVAQQVPENGAAQPDFFSTIKEKYGYGNQDELIADIESYRQFKASPPVQDFKFENEQSEKIFKALKEGKEQDIYNFLKQKNELERYYSADVDKTNADSIIKLGMKLKLKDSSLSDEEIDFKFNEDFPMPPKPVQKMDELDEEFSDRESQWNEVARRVEMRKIIEAKLLKSELEKAKSNLVLPEIQSQADMDYINYKKMVEESVEANKEISRAYQAFMPEQLETKINFTDEPNKIAFDFDYKPDAESLKKSVEYASDVSSFLDTFVNQDGTPDRKGFLEAIHFALNRKQILIEAMKQAKNAVLKSTLPDNTSGGLNRVNPTFAEPSELERQMKMAGVI